MSFFNTTITLLRGHEEPGHRFSLQVRVLVPGKTELIFAAARRGMARTLGLFHSTSAKAGGGWCHFPVFCVCSGVEPDSMWWAITCGWFACLVHSVICIVAVTACFLISLLFPVNCSCLNTCSLPFYSPSSPLHPFPSGKGRVEVRGQHTVWGVSVGTLNWEIPFINHESELSILETGWSPMCPPCQQPFHLKQNSEFHYPSSCKSITKSGPKFWLNSQASCAARLLKKDRCVRLSSENLANIMYITRVLYEEIQKVSNSLLKMVFFEAQLQKQIVWLQFSDRLLLIQHLELCYLCFFSKLNFVSVCYLSPLPDCFLPRSPHSSIKRVSFCVCPQSLKRPLGHKGLIFARGCQANY